MKYYHPQTGEVLPFGTGAKKSKKSPSLKEDTKISEDSPKIIVEVEKLPDSEVKEVVKEIAEKFEKAEKKEEKPKKTRAKKAPKSETA